jgi:phosphoglycolate phosphatase
VDTEPKMGEKTIERLQAPQYLFLFDFDGVIADSMQLYEEMTRRCFDAIGKPITKNHQDFLNLFNENFYEAIQRKGVSIDEFNDAAKQIVPTIDYSGVTAFEGVMPVLRELKKKNVLIIVSSNNVHAIMAILSIINLSSCFDDILGADFRLSKVDKIIYAMEKWNVSYNRTFFVGDTTGDIIEAKEAGVKAVAVTWGWHTKEKLEKAKPDVLIDSPRQLLDVDIYINK